MLSIVCDEFQVCRLVLAHSEHVAVEWLDDELRQSAVHCVAVLEMPCLQAPRFGCLPLLC